jgi:2-keto-4-pentenoate hydratase/2-oxohepta-3-ene-1,7-dioic acid hydratase in catechol pathway
MLLYRIGPEGFYAVGDESGDLRVLHSDPFEVRPGGWELGRAIESSTGLLAPVLPGKIVGCGRNYREHVEELENPLPEEPVIFLKSPSSIVGPKAPIILPPESQQVEFEGELAVVLRHRLRRASEDEARAAILGVTCANDVTARDLQRRDATFARAKSFDSFCPLGPAIRVDPEIEGLEVITRVNGEERQRAKTAAMTWGPIELLVYASRMMTLEVGDLLLTGTPGGVGRLTDGDSVEVDIAGVGVLSNPVEDWRRG